MTVMRRMMYRIAEGVAKKNDCLAIVNGESIGQVASQTLESMNTINQVITTPVIRPVACMDKLEIIKIAERLVHMISLLDHLKTAVQSLHHITQLLNLRLIKQKAMKQNGTLHQKYRSVLIIQKQLS